MPSLPKILDLLPEAHLFVLFGLAVFPLNIWTDKSLTL